MPFSWIIMNMICGNPPPNAVFPDLLNDAGIHGDRLYPCPSTAACSGKAPEQAHSKGQLQLFTTALYFREQIQALKYRLKTSCQTYGTRSFMKSAISSTFSRFLMVSMIWSCLSLETAKRLFLRNLTSSWSKSIA